MEIGVGVWSFLLSYYFIELLDLLLLFKVFYVGRGGLLGCRMISGSLLDWIL